MLGSVPHYVHHTSISLYSSAESHSTGCRSKLSLLDDALNFSSVLSSAQHEEQLLIDTTLIRPDTLLATDTTIQVEMKQCS